MKNTSHSTPRWQKRPPGSNWGDFGVDDQVGRLNLIDANARRSAASQVKEGLAFCLSLPLDFPGGQSVNPRRSAPKLQSTLRGDEPNMNFPLSRIHPNHMDVISDDAVLLHTQYSTQWDSLAHVGQWFDASAQGVEEMVYYNGFRAGVDVVGPVDWREGGNAPDSNRIGAQSLGIEQMAVTCVQGRGVIIDLAAHFPQQRHFVSYDDLMRILEMDQVEVEQGDLLCFRTGFDRFLLSRNRNPPARQELDAIQIGLDGRDQKLLQWITDCGASALISDNIGVELFPARPMQHRCAAHPLHAHCLFKLGMPLGELWLLSDLADWLRSHQRYRFLLTAPPLRLPGAVGSPVTPVGTV